jgi:DNA repair protein RecN (Recombination protein N)
MIQKLLIKNYALIQDLRLDPSPHLNTITGETGAGKSIMLGALGLLLGNRADTKVLFEEENKCVIEGVFDVSNQNMEALFEENDLDYQHETIMRREISASGKSRAFINDTPVTLDVMSSFGSRLVDIHSQRDTFLLGSPTYQLHIIDGYAKNRNLLDEYRTAYKIFRQRESAFQEIKHHAEALNKEADYNHFLLEELDKSSLREGEQAELEEELQIIEHAEEIKSKLFECVDLLNQSEFALIPGLQQVVKNIASVRKFAEHFNPLRERLETCLHELIDIGEEIDRETQKIDFDKKRQEEVNEKLSVIFQLLQKHQANSEIELIDIRKSLREKVERVKNMDAELDAAKKSMEQAESILIAAGRKLSASRTGVIPAFKKELEILLHDLAMPHATIKIEPSEIAPSSVGLDKISILFSANAGIAPDDLKKVASGGEFSRLMFAIKYMLAGKTFLPTIIFDEIDSGISGEVALKMVKMMREMSLRHQVVAITHLPQIAASGDRHYFVYKDHVNARSVSKIKRLEAKEREIEIAKMIGGDNPSDISIENARELLKMT